MTSATTDFPRLQLKKNEERRLRLGHQWVFSNEIDTQKTPLKALASGGAVELFDYRGQSLGTGYANPNSLIAARLMSRLAKHPFSMALIAHRLNVALALRERLHPEPYYRMVFGESDGLPGLVVDRFNDILVVQLTTAGMEVLKDEIIVALKKLVGPKTIHLRNDGAVRSLEGLDSYVETVEGSLPDVATVHEHGLTFEAPMAKGQKTGWFYDQADNRRDLERWVRGARVLDLFSYVGGWGVQAAVQGAASVTCIDESAIAIDFVRRNAELNQVAGKVEAIQSEAFQALKQLKEAKESFDVIIVDPPAFIKRRKDGKKGLEAYERLNEMAMKLLPRDGILISCSCSYHLSRPDLVKLLHRKARHLDRQLTILAQGYQSVDHPVHPAIPETEYLKVLFTRIHY